MGGQRSGPTSQISVQVVRLCINLFNYSRVSVCLSLDPELPLGSQFEGSVLDSNPLFVHVQACPSNTPGGRATGPPINEFVKPQVVCKLANTNL